MADPDVKWTLDNIYTLTRRSLRALERNTQDVDALVVSERTAWGHVLRLCEQAGCEGDGVLRGTLSITVNGVNRIVAEGALSYSGVLALAGYAPLRRGAERVLSVTYSTRRRGDEQRAGTLTPGQTVQLEDGMIVNAYDTSNA